MKSFLFFISACLAAFSLSGSAFAAPQTVYRCGDSYSQVPCPNGTVVHADDPRDDSQRAQAQTALQRDKALAKDIEASRRKDEAQELALNKAALARAHAAHTAGGKKPEKTETREKAPKKAPGKRMAKVKEPEAGVFTATAPGQTPKKKNRKSAATTP